MWSPVTAAIDAPVSDRPGWVEHLDRLHLLTPLRIAAIFVVAVIVTMILGRILKRAVRRTMHLVGQRFELDQGRSDARERAIASALRSALIGVIWAAVVITVIGELGVNIGGVLATATVIGGAVAFGAQTLVRDVIAGFFVLVEDQYGVGDEVDLGLAQGAVQRITLRTVRLRDQEGRVWHVPHGNVQRVANLSASPLALIDLEVDRAMPLARLDEMAAQLCRALADDPVAGPLLAETPRALGVLDIRDDRVVYRLVAATEPGRQADVQRIWRTLAVSTFADENSLRAVSSAAAPA
jgi:small conductance mechanosensitive channel